MLSPVFVCPSAQKFQNTILYDSDDNVLHVGLFDIQTLSNLFCSVPNTVFQKMDVLLSLCMSGAGAYCFGSSRVLLNLWIFGWATEMHSHRYTQEQKQICCVVFGTLGDAPSQAPALSVQSFRQLTLTYYFLPAAQFQMPFASGHSFTSVKDSQCMPFHAQYLTNQKTVTFIIN